jgi:hypothetical protein
MTTGDQGNGDGTYVHDAGKTAGIKHLLDKAIETGDIGEILWADICAAAGNPSPSPNRTTVEAMLVERIWEAIVDALATLGEDTAVATLDAACDHYNARARIVSQLIGAMGSAIADMHGIVRAQFTDAALTAVKVKFDVTPPRMPSVDEAESVIGAQATREHFERYGRPYGGLNVQPGQPSAAELAAQLANAVTGPIPPEQIQRLFGDEELHRPDEAPIVDRYHGLGRMPDDQS